MPENSRTRRSLIVKELSRVDGLAPGRANPGTKHLKMAMSPFRFLRGAAQLYYADIRSGLLPLPKSLAEPRQLTTVMGDCHVSNFGFLTEEGSHGDSVVFAPNDFDDACTGPGVWDLARFSTSLLLVAEYCRGLVEGRYTSDEIEDPGSLKAPSHSQAMACAESFLTVYRATCEAMIADSDWWATALDDFADGHVLAKPLEKAVARSPGGQDFEHRSALGKAVTIESDVPKFRALPDRFVSLDRRSAAAIRKVFRPYVDDDILDLVRRKGAGTGSVNVDRFYLLVGPENFRGRDDLSLCHVVEVKQQRQAAAIHYFPDISPTNTLNPAHLTIDCQRRMQRRPDLVLDEVLWRRSHWLVRSRHHARVTIDPEEIALSRKKPQKRLLQYAAACGETLALAHGRADRRSTRFEEEMCEQLAKHGETLLEASAGYALQTESDWASLRSLLGM